MGIRLFRKHQPYGEYPACSHLNCALRKLLCSVDENRVAIEEIVYAITKAHGYIHDDVKDALTKNHVLWFGEKKEEAQQDCTYNKNGHCMGQKLMPECDAKNCDRKKP